MSGIVDLDGAAGVRFADGNVERLSIFVEEGVLDIGLHFHKTDHIPMIVDTDGSAL